MNFTLIAYKKDLTTTCRGCEMERYHSDFRIFTDLTKEELIKEWSRIMHENEVFEGGDFKVTILAGGRTIYDDNCMSIGNANIEDYSPEAEAIDNLSSEMHAIKGAATAAIAQRKQEADERSRKAYAAQKARDEDAQRQRELNELKRLTEKYTPK